MHADDYGPISIAARKTLGEPTINTYFEYSFDVVNRSNEAHVLRLEAITDLGGRQQSARASRTFHLPPRSSTVAVLPQLMTARYSAGRVEVDIDGARQERPLELGMQSTFDYSRTGQVLVSSSVRMDRPAAALNFVRAGGAGEWSTSWLQYGRFLAVAITDADWLQLPAPVQNAILRATYAGGALVFLGRPEGLPALREGRQEVSGFYGLGRVSILASREEPVDEAFLRALVDWSTRGRGYSTTTSPIEHELLQGPALPMRALFTVLCAFAVIGGPLNLFALAKKNRRVWVFWTIPALAVVTSLLLVGATIANEGWVRVSRSESFTLLDEDSGEAVTVGYAGFYATMAPRGEVRFAADTELRPVGEVFDAETRWDDGQRLFGSWVGTRVASHVALRRVERRRERLPLRFEGSSVVAVNGLGAHIERLYVALQNGEVLEAKDVAPGQPVTLARGTTLRNVRNELVDPAYRYWHGGVWGSLQGLTEQDPGLVLQRGTYVAVLRDSPFVERALERPTTSSAHGVVLGYVKGGGHAR